MDDFQLEEIPESKLYKTGNITLAAFFGGAIVGIYLLAENFRKLGRAHATYFTWIVGIFLFMLVNILRLYFFRLAEIPGIFYWILNALIVTWAGRHYQLAAINAHIDKGGELYPPVRVVIVTLIGMGIWIFLALVLFFVQDTMAGHF
ncbi:MAG TPA: hypothetical protein VG738_14820 [Chitinophagaceae bacterium]|nr:hypothetical protein [Chitinophagaceae bacterium]